MLPASIAGSPDGANAGFPPCPDVGFPASPSAASPQDRPALHRLVLEWYADHARPLPWRRREATPWEVFVSEVMSQQTPLSRVEPAWREWLGRWPTPAALASASPGEVVRAWGRLGYPRRALRLREAALAMVARHDGRVPASVEELRALPGVGEYTAAAVACFAYGVRVPVVDTNVRRVLARLLRGSEPSTPAVSGADRTLAAAVLPNDVTDAATWNVAAMELGSLVCTAREPRCGRCPVLALCAWKQAGGRVDAPRVRRAQTWAGSDRQVRGALLRVLRDAPAAVSSAELRAAWPHDEQQRRRCLAALVADGLAEELEDGWFRLPG